MKCIRLIIALTLFLFLNKTSAIAQSANDIIKVDRISLEQGFSNDLIFSIFQDSKGFIWFGTMFGLVKYDGMNYKTYRYDPIDSNTLSNDDVISIFEDKDCNMWFGTYNGGLNKYEPVTGKFTRFIRDPDNPASIGSNTIWDICQDKDGIMWLATEGGGLNKFENGKFYSYKKDTNNADESISGNFIRSVATDKNGNIWAGTFASGINMLDKKKNIFVNYRLDSNDAGSISNNFITYIFNDTEGELWTGTGGGGLCKFESDGGKFIRYKNKADDENEAGNNFINSISEDTPGKFLIATNNGLYTFDKVTGEFKKIIFNADKKKAGENVTGFIKDRSGVIWICSYNEGLFKLQYSRNKFSNFLSENNVKCIYEDRSGRLWVGTHDNGLIMSEDKGLSFNTVLNNKGDGKFIVSSSYVKTIAEDIEGNIWAGTDNGLIKTDKNVSRIEKIKNIGDTENSLISNNILKLLIDRSGILWIGTDKGLDKYDPGTKIFKHYQFQRNDTNSLSENTILSLYEDKYGELWIGTYFGLNKLEKNQDNFRHYRKNPEDPESISNNYVFSFNEDKNNNFWIGTGGGLNIFDRSKGTFYHFTENDGLPNGVIAGLESDENGYLWISTYKGISRLSVKDRVFRNFDAEDGLLSNMFNPGAYLKDSSGVIFFGSLKGVNYFIPGEVRESKFTAPVILTSMIKYNGKIKSETDISSKKEIILSYDDNFIKLGFTSIDYTNPSRNKFSYMLDGFDQDWNSSGREAVYTNLNPGEYIFRVKGTNSDGVWNNSEASVKIIITPPFWKTLWFYAILFCSAIAGIFYIQNLRIRSKVKYYIELEKIREKERELMREQASRDYHDELGHKLTRISLYSRRINKKLRPTANGLTEDLNSIVETSNSLQSGAKDLIWAMNPQEDSLYDFTVRLREFGNELFDNTGINFSSNGIKIEFKDIVLSMDRKRHLMYIFKEGMNNILKYSLCANVNLNFMKIDNELQIILKDDGRGFDLNNCSKGYGLKNIYSRAKQIGVKVIIKSEEKVGTEIILRANTEDLVIN